MQEIWKDIFFIDNGIIYDYRGFYQVSNLGRVKSLWYGQEKILNPAQNKNGYLQVYLCKNKQKQHFRLHKLIANVFLENPENKPQINHINGKKNDNRAENLEWVTSSENNKHAFNLGLKKARTGKENSCSKKVLQYDMRGRLIKEWESMMDIQRELKIRNSLISACCKGLYKQTHNYIWKYKDTIN